MISLVPLSLRFDPGSPHPSAPLTPSPLGKATLVVTFDVAPEILRSFHSLEDDSAGDNSIITSSDLVASLGQKKKYPQSQKKQ